MAPGELEKQVVRLETFCDGFRAEFDTLGQKIDRMQTTLSALNGGLEATLVSIQHRQDNTSERLRDVEQVTAVLLSKATTENAPSREQRVVDTSPQVSLEASWVKSKPLRSTILGTVIAGLLIIALAACGRYVIDASVDRTVKVLQERVLKGAL